MPDNNLCHKHAHKGPRLCPGCHNSEEPHPANPMIAEALAKGEDATGLCTVREFAEAIMEQPVIATPDHFVGSMWFNHKGCRYSVTMVVNRE